MPKTLRQRAIDLLSHREHSQFELVRKLTPYAESKDELQQLIEDLCSNGWQSDERFVEQYIRAKSTKYGMTRIVQELKLRGIDDRILREQISNIDQKSAFETAYSLWQRKFGTLPENPNELAKQIRFLATRGFSQQIIKFITQGKNMDDFS